jgi:hypothetical protein
MANIITYKIKTKPNEVFGHDYKSVVIEDGTVTIEVDYGDDTEKTIKLTHDELGGHLCIWVSD